MQKNSRKNSIRWSAVVLTMIAVAGCGNNQSTNKGGGNPTTGEGTTKEGAVLTNVNIGYTPTIVLPQPLVGVVYGEYQKEMPGITFESKLYNAGSAVVEALRSGVIDIGASGPYPALKGYAKSGDIILLAGAATGGTELMVNKSGAVKTLHDLKGKAVGVNQPGSTVDSLVRYNLLKAGLKPDTDVRIVEIAPGEQAETLKAGEVAAVAAPAPWPSQVAVNGNGRPLLNWKQILDNGTYSAGSIYTTKKFAQAHPDFIKQFLAAHQTITDRLNKDRAKGDAQVLAAWSKVTKKTLTPPVAKAAFSTIKFTTEPDPKGLQRSADIAFETGALKKKADLNGFVYQAP